MTKFTFIKRGQYTWASLYPSHFSLTFSLPLSLSNFEASASSVSFLYPSYPIRLIDSRKRMIKTEHVSVRISLSPRVRRITLRYRPSGFIARLRYSAFLLFYSAWHVNMYSYMLILLLRFQNLFRLSSRVSACDQRERRLTLASAIIAQNALPLRSLFNLCSPLLFPSGLSRWHRRYRHCPFRHRGSIFILREDIHAECTAASRVAVVAGFALACRCKRYGTIFPR